MQVPEHKKQDHPQSVQIPIEDRFPIGKRQSTAVPRFNVLRRAESVPLGNYGSLGKVVGIDLSPCGLSVSVLYPHCPIAGDISDHGTSRLGKLSPTAPEKKETAG